jgi:hypothetical protein
MGTGKVSNEQYYFLKDKYKEAIHELDKRRDLVQK